MSGPCDEHYDSSTASSGVMTFTVDPPSSFSSETDRSPSFMEVIGLYHEASSISRSPHGEQAAGSPLPVRVYILPQAPIMCTLHRPVVKHPEIVVLEPTTDELLRSPLLQELPCSASDSSPVFQASVAAGMASSRTNIDKNTEVRPMTRLIRYLPVICRSTACTSCRSRMGRDRFVPLFPRSL